MNGSIALILADFADGTLAVCNEGVLFMIQVQSADGTGLPVITLTDQPLFACYVRCELAVLNAADSAVCLDLAGSRATFMLVNVGHRAANRAQVPVSVSIAEHRITCRMRSLGDDFLNGSRTIRAGTKEFAFTAAGCRRNDFAVIPDMIESFNDNLCRCVTNGTGALLQAFYRAGSRSDDITCVPNVVANGNRLFFRCAADGTGVNLLSLFNAACSFRHNAFVPGVRSRCRPSRPSSGSRHP